MGRGLGALARGVDGVAPASDDALVEGAETAIVTLTDDIDGSEAEAPTVETGNGAAEPAALPEGDRQNA